MDPALLQAVLDDEDGDHHVRFAYSGYAIRVDGEGSVVLTERRSDG
ncbi:MAG: HalOD1 output domain-containing protein [Halanaeroarchaeum sp.]